MSPDVIKESLDRFYEVDVGGVQAPIVQCDEVEKLELELIERGLRYDDANCTWVVSYPWIRDPGALPNNFKAI